MIYSFISRLSTTCHIVMIQMHAHTENCYTHKYKHAVWMKIATVSKHNNTRQRYFKYCQGFKQRYTYLVKTSLGTMVDLAVSLRINNHSYKYTYTQTHGCNSMDIVATNKTCLFSTSIFSIPTWHFRNSFFFF